ncbi:hypothetical protein PG997_014838 [Apiospora hydei]|uniref:Nephrocystin 3-like N-terminal domain-containing protein n=1 Tax=Apiospora hydei TaxID=1337664 RepID=A0ABR1UUY6_9PEZI
MCRYSPDQDKFVQLMGPSAVMSMPTGPVMPQSRPTPGSVNEMGFWTEVFPQAMSRLTWGIRHLSVWADVQAKLDMARREYDHYNGQQNIGKFRRKLRRSLDKAAVPIQQGMKLVPDIEIASPVVGAIDLLVDAYRQAAAVRETVHSGFDDLPETFIRIDFFMKSYPKDENILAVSIDLVLAVFKAIEEASQRALGALTIYLAAKHAGLAILNGEEYQQNLLRALKEISVCSEKLEEGIPVIPASRDFSGIPRTDGNAARQAHTTMMQNDWATHQTLGAILNGQLQGNAQIAWIAKLLTIFLGVLSDRENNWRPLTPTPLLPNTVSSGMLLPSPNPGPVQWTKTELLSHLAAPLLDEVDLQNVLFNSGEAILEHRERAEQVMATRELRDWMTTRGSYRLHVHGNFDSTDAIDRRVTPLSVLCATLVRTLRVNSESVDGICISLVFFCGLHRREDAYSGGVVMIRSLAQQLVEHFPAPTIELDPRLDIAKLEHGDLIELCRLFMCLMYKLPPEVTVFCLIDGVQEYERSEHLPDMMTVVMTLTTLVNECNRPTGAYSSCC